MQAFAEVRVMAYYLKNVYNGQLVSHVTGLHRPKQFCEFFKFLGLKA